MVGWGMVGCAHERVAMGLEGTRQGHQWVMPMVGSSPSPSPARAPLLIRQLAAWPH